MNKLTNRDLTSDDVAKIIEDFLNGTGGRWDWEGFTDSGAISDLRLEEIRQKSIDLPRQFPPTKSSSYTNEKGLALLREFAEELRRPRGDR